MINKPKTHEFNEDDREAELPGNEGKERIEKVARDFELGLEIEDFEHRMQIIELCRSRFLEAYARESLQKGELSYFGNVSNGELTYYLSYGVVGDAVKGKKSKKTIGFVLAEELKDGQPNGEILCVSMIAPTKMSLGSRLDIEKLGDFLKSTSQVFIRRVPRPGSGEREESYEVSMDSARIYDPFNRDIEKLAEEHAYMIDNAEHMKLRFINSNKLAEILNKLQQITTLCPQKTSELNISPF